MPMTSVAAATVEVTIRAVAEFRRGAVFLRSV
jgi:hypothetical protein